MIPISLEKLAKIVNVVFVGDKEGLQKQVIGLEIDSRKIKVGDIFAPIVGEKVDAHRFIPTAFETGAVCCFSYTSSDCYDWYVKLFDDIFC